MTTSVAGTSVINLFGNEFGQLIVGNSGSNIINGLTGSDTLRGNLGNDSFIFDTALGAANIDTIEDFSVADDIIRLENAIFTGLVPARLLLPPSRPARQRRTRSTASSTTARPELCCSIVMGQERARPSSSGSSRPASP